MRSTPGILIAKTPGLSNNAASYWYSIEGTLLETYALDTPLTHITVDVSENVLYAIGHEPQTCLMKLVLDN